jgi:hypothetical protein
MVLNNLPDVFWRHVGLFVCNKSKLALFAVTLFDKVEKVGVMSTDMQRIERYNEGITYNVVNIADAPSLPSPEAAAISGPYHPTSLATSPWVWGYCRRDPSGRMGCRGLDSAPWLWLDLW